MQVFKIPENKNALTQNNPFYTKPLFLCPICNDELEETVDKDTLYCIKCQSTYSAQKIKDTRQ